MSQDIPTRATVKLQKLQNILHSIRAKLQHSSKSSVTTHYNYMCKTYIILLGFKDDKQGNKALLVALLQFRNSMFILLKITIYQNFLFRLKLYKQGFLKGEEFCLRSCDFYFLRTTATKTPLLTKHVTKSQVFHLIHILAYKAILLIYV